MTTAADWDIEDADRDLFRRELDSFVPERIFDAHAHWYVASHFPDASRPGLVASGPPEAGFRTWKRCMEELLPGRAADSGLFFPFPNAAVDVTAANRFLCQELTAAPGARGQLLVTPGMDPDLIRETVVRYGLAGLKCYHVFSSHSPTFDSAIEDYLPESHIQLADQLGLSITLHMVRARALADPVNQQTIRDWCLRYPNLKMILAHAARGFNPHHTIEGIAALRGLDNVWFDTSVVTDSGAIEAISREFGHGKLLYGSDFPVTHLRGRCIALGDSFFWISADNTRLQVPYADMRLALVGHEALRTLKVAAMSLGWTDSQVEDVFYGNAARLYGLPESH